MGYYYYPNKLKKEIAEAYSNGKSTYALEKEYGIRRGTIRHWVNIRKEPKFSISIKEKAINDYVVGMSCREVADKYKTTHTTIIRWVGSKIRTHKQSNKLMSIKIKGVHRSLDTEFIKGQCSWNKGKLLPQMQGENHPNWKGGKRKYPKEFNDYLKEYIRDEYNRECQICFKNEFECDHKLDIHHIDYIKENLEKDNLIPLCKSCHCKTNFNRSYWYEFFKYKDGIRL